jgi:hypothetical protein
MCSFEMAAQIRDLLELRSAFGQILERMRGGDREAAETSLRFARGLVNVSTFLEPHAKAILTSVFAEIHSILDPNSTDCDVLLDNFIHSMEFIYGSEHIVMSDCFTMLSSFYATNDRIPVAIEVSCLLHSLSHLIAHSTPGELSSTGSPPLASCTLPRPTATTTSACSIA